MNDNSASERQRMYTNYSAVLAELKHKGRTEDYAALADTLKRIEHHLSRKYPEPKTAIPHTTSR